VATILMIFLRIDYSNVIRLLWHHHIWRTASSTTDYRLLVITVCS